MAEGGPDIGELLRRLNEAHGVQRKQAFVALVLGLLAAGVITLEIAMALLAPSQQ